MNRYSYSTWNDLTNNEPNSLRLFIQTHILSLYTKLKTMQAIAKRIPEVARMKNTIARVNDIETTFSSGTPS